MNFTRTARIIILTLLASQWFHARADLITLINADQCETVIEFYVEKGGVRVTFEIGPQDFKAFQEIVPEQYGGVWNSENSEMLLRMFALNRFRVASGQKLLSPKLITAEMRDRIQRTSLYTGKVDTTLNLSKEVFYVELYYDAPKLKTLTIGPPLEDGEVIPANIGFVLYHNKMPVNDLRFLSVASTVTLDWSDPWYSSFDHRNYTRHHKNSLMSFLYVDPYEVRHEILVRLKDLEEWIALDYRIDDIIHVDEFDSIKNLVGEFLKTRNILTMDGKTPTPIISKVQFLEVSLSGTQIVSENQDIPYASAIIGIILSYPNEGIPQHVEVSWDMFSDKIDQIPYVTADPAGPLPGFVDPENTVIKWQNYLKDYQLPTVANFQTEQVTLPLGFPIFILLLIAGIVYLIRSKRKQALYLFCGSIIVFLVSGSGLFNPNVELPLTKTKYQVNEARFMNQTILSNIYRSFDFTTESEIYDKLALSIEGQLLSDVYIEIKKSMVLENQGGLEVNIDEVIVHDAEEITSEQYVKGFNVKWNVQGQVGHWGHIHKRENAYQARLYYDIHEGSWKLKKMEVLQEDRIL